MYILEALYSLFLLLISYWHIVFLSVLALILLLLFSKYLRALLSRIGFALKLNSLCKKNKLKIKYSNYLFLFAYLKKKKHDISIYKGKELCYQIKLFSPKSLKRNIYLKDENEAYITKASAQTLVGRGASVGGQKRVVNVVETNKRKAKLCLPETSKDSISVLLFQPSPLDFYILNGNNYKKAGSGEDFFGIKLFEGKDFLKYLSRNM